MSDREGVWLVGETDKGSLTKATLQILGVGRQVADALSTSLCIILLGEEPGHAAEESIRHACDRVYVWEDECLSECNPDIFSAALEKILTDTKPDVILAAHTALGQDLLPRLAARLKTQVVTDCVEIDYDRQGDKLLMTKPTHGGNALAVFSCSSQPVMATVRMGAAEPPQPDPSRKGDILPIAFKPDPGLARTKVRSRSVENENGIGLEDAPIVVSGGRGIGGQEGFEQLRELAEFLGAAVGVSRPPCDLGWMPSSFQVGFTGKIVAPEVYFAVGISGAMQHLSGMYDSKHIIAVNKDPEANIFNYSDYGIVADYREAVPAFIEKMRELSGK
jgi:electron transfer flavoprotein alpha subunit